MVNSIGTQFRLLQEKLVKIKYAELQ